MRQITIDFNTSLIEAGYLGEHNATELVIVKPVDVIGAMYSVAFMTNGEVIHSKYFYDNEEIRVPLWQQLTQDYELGVQLEAYDEKGDYLGKSAMITLLFGGSAHGTDVIADSDNPDVYSEIALNTWFRETLEDNADTLDKLTTSKDGTLLFDGKKIEGVGGSSSLDVEVKTDTEDEYVLEIITDTETITTPNLKGADGKSGVYVGSGDMPDGYNVQIDPEGDTDYLQITPLFANSIEECTDTSKVYVLPDGYIYAYKESTSKQEATEHISGEVDNTRVSSGSTVIQNGYVTTPLIDLRAYPVPFTLHLDGVPYIPSTVENYSRYATFDTAQAFLVSQKTSTNLIQTDIGGTATAYADGKSTIVFDSIKDNLQYVRFSGSGTSAASNIYVTYTEEVTAEQWTNTGVRFVSDGIDEEILDKIAELNNEGDSPSTIKLLSAPVLDFYNKPAYSDNDYSASYLSKITYPCRADIPVPYTVKWNHNENAMRTTVAVDTRAIGTANKFTMLTYNATGFNNYPLYNLLPNTTYYYKVTHILADGSIVEAKSGSFKTSSESIRLIYIDGTQNVRDFGGWIGLDNKRVKYGKIFRGASLADTSYPELVATGNGKRALGELKIQAELNLGTPTDKTTITPNCAFEKIGYSNYATAITDVTARENFKTALEFIVRCLDGSLVETGLPVVERNVYINCQGGCDRTGTISFLLLGLLGVSESDLAKEYELSSFSSVGFGRLRTTTKEKDTYDYVGMVEALKAYSGDTITDKFYNFATTGCGILAETITAFRNLMLETR